MRPVMGLGTGQRNLAAAMLVAGGSFSDKPNVLVMVMLVAIFGLIMLGVIAGEMGKRAQAPADGNGAKTSSDDQGEGKPAKTSSDDQGASAQ
jgi:BASS family bile acid:Na+ symporter